MKKFLLIIAFASVISGCHKDSPATKILDGLPLTTAPLTIPPAQAIQQFLLLKNAVLEPVIVNLNRLNQPTYFPPQSLTGPDGSMNYTLVRTEKHYGTAICTIQFRNSGNGAIDPFLIRSTTTTVASVHIAVNSTSAEFTGTEDYTLTLNQVGVLSGPYTMNGTSVFNGSSYSINFAIPSPITANSDGLINGNATATGSGPTAPVSATLVFGVESDISGSLTWEGQTAGIHVAKDGSGYLTTKDSRILFQ